MNLLQRLLFHTCMFLSLAAMVWGHAVIINSGKWFIPGTEKYNILTRWVSDFAAVWWEGLWIKASIGLFCIALIIFKRAKLRTCSGGALGHARWGWNVVLAIGLIAGLLLVAFYDMSPPQFTVKEPSWFGRLLGESARLEEIPRGSGDYIKQWHHRLGFLMFIISFAVTLVTATVEKLQINDVLRVRRDVLFLVLTGIFMLWLFAFHNSYAGIPQRALLTLIFLWIWGAGARLSRYQTATERSMK